MMRFILVSICAFVLAATSASTVNAANSLTGKMSMYNYLVGTWACEATGAGAEKQTSPALHVLEIYSVAEGNTLHLHFAARGNEADGFIGHRGAFWYSSVDNQGGHQFGLSDDGATYRGFIWLGDDTSHKSGIMMTQRKLDENKRTKTGVRAMDGGTVKAVELCKRL
jgi:hypothetical protein